jgi:DNA-binding SARP family transcriptional activator
VAIEAGLAAVRADPLRESAHRVLIEAHLLEGNRCEALRQFRAYEALMRAQLGLAPSATIVALIERATAC